MMFCQKFFWVLRMMIDLLFSLCERKNSCVNLVILRNKSFLHKKAARKTFFYQQLDQTHWTNACKVCQEQARVPAGEEILKRGLCESIISQPISPGRWVLLWGVQYIQPGCREKGLHSSSPPDPQQKYSTTSSSGFSAPFVSHHQFRMQNGSGGNPTLHLHFSLHPFQSYSDKKVKQDVVLLSPFIF